MRMYNFVEPISANCQSQRIAFHNSKLLSNLTNHPHRSEHRVCSPIKFVTRLSNKPTPTPTEKNSQNKAILKTLQISLN
jgi:hypothetical protein